MLKGITPPESQPETILFIEGGAYTDVKKALLQWIDSYTNQLEKYPDVKFNLHKNGRGKHVIQIDGDLDNMLFYFLVNYMSYPEGIDYSVKVTGFTTGTELNVLQGKQLQVYLPEFDTEWDSVLITTADQQSYKMSFTGKLIGSSEERSYQKPVFTEKEAPVILKANLKKLQDTLENEKSIENRLKWGFIVVIAIQILHALFIKFFSYDQVLPFHNVPIFVFLGISFWFYWDYKLLRTYSRYLKCLLLTGALLLYMYLLVRMELFEISKYEITVVIYPLVLLVFQLPLRLTFIHIFNKEPKVERRPDFYGDGLYTYVLLLGSMLFSLVLSMKN